MKILLTKLPTIYLTDRGGTLAQEILPLIKTVQHQMVCLFSFGQREYLQCGNLGCVKHLVERTPDRSVKLSKDLETWTLHNFAG